MKGSIFTDIQQKRPPYSTFQLSHQKKLSGKMGELIPILALDTVPGDTITLRTAQMLRMAPMIAPIMHQVTIYTHFFFVPNRILWPNWEDFITGGEDGTADPAAPTINIVDANWTKESVADYIGLPEPNGEDMRVSALPFAAYNKIYNEYYRDQNLIDKLTDSLVDGGQPGSGDIKSVAIDRPLKRAWQHDYFTSCLPFTQKGPEATIPVGGEATVKLYGIDGNPDLPAGSTQKLWDFVNDAYAGAGTVQTGGAGNLTHSQNPSVAEFIDPGGSLYADLSTATAASINELRNAFRLQEWLEKNARGGSRYTESILSHFGVRSSDGRLQRPEFIGGGSAPIAISEVLQTSSTDATTPQGNMAGHGISLDQNGAMTYRCEEHGWIIGIMSVMPKTAYQQGVPKKFLRTDKFDYYWPSFAHLGEQAVTTQEIYQGSGLVDTVFGYIPRYAEYKYENDTVHGEFRDTLDFWHLGRKFATAPALNQTFIECDPSTRIFANENGEQFYAHVNHSITAKRPMPYYGTPKM